MWLTDSLLGLSLAADAFVAALALGLKQRPNFPRRWFMIVPLMFGAFQGLMPLFGWKAMAGFSTGWFGRIDHWVAFVILVLVGGNMVRQALKQSDSTITTKPLSIRLVLSLAVATSLDALAVGLTLPTVSAHPLNTCLVVGLITAGLSALALIGTTYIPRTIARPAEALAGVILIGLGCKILWYA